MWAIGLVVGALIGAGMDQGGSIFWGALIGFVLGLLAGRWKKMLLERVSKLEARVELLARAASANARELAPTPGAAAAPTGVVAAEAELPVLEAVPKGAAEPTAAGAPRAVAAAGDAAVPVRKGGMGVAAYTTAAAELVTAPAGTEPTSESDARPAWLAWIAGGNTLARIGVVLLFIGVAFLVKYATEHTRVPIELRLAAVAPPGETEATRNQDSR